MTSESTASSTFAPIARRVRDRRRRFSDWRASRPFAGGVLLVLASLPIAFVPLQMAGEMLLLGNAISAIGLLFAAAVFTSGLLALTNPQHSTYIGAAGIVASMLSVFGALGGLLIGTFIGVIGGSLCVGWTDEPPMPDEDEDGLLARVTERL